MVALNGKNGCTFRQARLVRNERYNNLPIFSLLE